MTPFPSTPTAPTSGRHRAKAPRAATTASLRFRVAALAIVTLLVPAFLASPAVAAPTTGQPIGNLDKVTAGSGTIRVEGWAWDPDTSAAVTVTVRVGAATVTTQADRPRPDVARVIPDAGGSRGFTIDIDSGSGLQTVCVTLSNAGNGTDRPFTCRTVTVSAAPSAPQSPFGNVDVASGAATGVTVAGWAADRDTSVPLTVTVTVDGSTSTTTTSLPRADVVAAFPGLSPTTGFRTMVSAGPGVHNVCTTVTNVGSGTDTAFRCRIVTVPGTPTSATPAPGPGGAHNTGVPAGTTLTVHDGDLTITVPGTVVDSLDVRGYVRVKAANVTIKNSIIRGRAGLTSYMSLVQASSTGLTISDSELVAAHPNAYIDGIVGAGFTLTRVNIHGVVDSVKIAGNDVLVQSSWLHDNLYYTSDPNYGGGATHDDNVQIQRGSNITVRSTTMSSTHNAAMMITQDSGAVSNVTFVGNAADGGACTINVAEKSYGPVRDLRITDNLFGTATRVKHCAVLLPPTTTSIAMIAGNTFTDGTTFSVSRGS